MCQLYIYNCSWCDRTKKNVVIQSFHQNGFFSNRTLLMGCEEVCVLALKRATYTLKKQHWKCATNDINMFVYIYIYIHIYRYSMKLMAVYIYIYMRAYMYIHVWRVAMWKNICIYMYIFKIYIHIYIYIYVFTFSTHDIFVNMVCNLISHNKQTWLEHIRIYIYIYIYKL